MSRLNLSTILLVVVCLNQPAFANSESEPDTPAADQSASAPPTPAPGAETAPAPGAETAPAPGAESASSGELRTGQKDAGQLSRDEICQMIEAAASGEALPFEFLARLIWQESKFNPSAVSHAGAVGIAQFMPKVASGRGLANPFEPEAALHESAEFLRELRDQFGNLGLAAAAYNAGPKRVLDWLHKRGSLPRETQNYVHIITGYRAQKWTTSAPSVETVEFDNQQCNEIAKLAAQRYRLAALERLASAATQRADSKASRAARNSTRSRVLARRNGQSANHVEQVSRLVARAGKPSRVDRIIRLTVQSRGATAVRVADAAKSKPGAGKGSVKVAAVSAQKKKGSAPGKVRVAANERPSRKKS